MDSDLCNVVIAISKNKSLKHLNMSRTMKKHMSLIMDSVVQVVQDDECLLQSLIIPDCRLRSDLYNLLNALGDNKSLETLDISGKLFIYQNLSENNFHYRNFKLAIIAPCINLIGYDITSAQRY